MMSLFTDARNPLASPARPRRRGPQRERSRGCVPAAGSGYGSDDVFAHIAYF